MYQKLTSDPNYIRFYYPYASIFDKVKLETEYRASKINAEDGTPLIDRFAMTNNEQDGFEHHLKHGIYRVGENVLKLTFGLLNAIFDAEAGNDIVGFYALDKENYNDNILALINNEVELILTNYCLFKWYESCGLQNEFGVAYQNYVTARNKLTEMVFELLKPDLEAIPTAPAEAGDYKILSISVKNIIAGVTKTVNHTFGSSTYFVNAIQPDGTSIPGFDDMIENRGSSSLSFTSAIPYSQATLLLIGVI